MPPVQRAGAVASSRLVFTFPWAARQGVIPFPTLIAGTAKYVRGAGHHLVVEDRLKGVKAMFAKKPLTEDTIRTLASAANEIAQGYVAINYCCPYMAPMACKYPAMWPSLK